MGNTRKQLASYALSLIDACERDFEAAQKRLDRARAIHEHLKAGKPIGDCPCPVLNDTAGQAERFAARVDALLFTVYEEEEQA